MKKWLAILCALFLMAGCGAPAGDSSQSSSLPEDSSSAAMDQSDHKAVAAALFTDLTERQYDSLAKYTFDEAMSEVVRKNGLKPSLDASFAQLGKVTELHDCVSVQSNGYDIVSVPAVFENGRISLNVVFDGQDRIAGIHFADYPQDETAALALPEGAQELDYSFTARDGKTFSGSLVLPSNHTSSTLVILVHGSGPNDRNETLYRNTPFRDLAYLLAQQGVASYRYDKRTFLYAGECAADSGFTVKEETVYDAADAFSAFRQQTEYAFDRIIILGHSLGGFLIPQIDGEVQADGYIMLAAPSGNFADLMKQQYEYLRTFADENQKAAYDAQLQQLEQLRDLEALDATKPFMGAYPAYWKDLLSYDPLQAAESLSAPVLVLQGEEDYQVPMSEYERWKNAFGDRASWQFHSYPGLSHLMMPGDLTKNPSSYYEKLQSFDSSVAADIAAFAKS